jgi:hypothetical protein
MVIQYNQIQVQFEEYEKRNEEQLDEPVQRYRWKENHQI